MQANGIYGEMSLQMSPKANTLVPKTKQTVQKDLHWCCIKIVIINQILKKNHWVQYKFN